MNIITPEIPHAKHQSPRSRQTGSVAMTVALLLTVLLSVMAFTIDAGYLHWKKNQYQNAVDAAAMAGAMDLCGADPAATARRIAAQNGIEGALDEDTLKVRPGFYDANDAYPDDFSEFRDFEADPDPETPENEAVYRIDGDCCQYNNAVLVQLEQSEKPLAGALRGNDSPVVIKTAAVAYLKRYDILAGEDGLTVNPFFADGYPRFLDTTIHANGNIQFQGTEEFTGDGRITATDDISGCTAAHEAGAAEVELKPLDMEMEELRARAEREGTLVQMDEWPVDHSWNEATFGQYQRRSSTTVWITLAAGDHNGSVYYLSTDSETETAPTLQTLRLLPNPEEDTAAQNFTITTDASELYLRITPVDGAKSITLGGEGKGAAHIYAADLIVFQPLPSSGNYYRLICDGVFFRCRKFQHIWYSRASDEIRSQKMRIFADEITYQGRTVGIPADPVIDALFGPPCPPAIVRMGRLEG